MRTSSAVYTLIGLCAVLLVGIAVLFLVTKESKVVEDASEDISHMRSVLTIETEVLPRLSPHHHFHDDEVSDHGHGVVMYASELVTSEDMWVSGLSVQVKNAPRSSLHHANMRLYLPSSPDLTSPLLQYRNMLGLSIGQDIVETMTVPDPYAIFIPKGSTLETSVMMHNPVPPEGPGGDYHDVSVAFVLLESPLATHIPIVPISIALVDETSRGNDSFVVPANTRGYVRTAYTDTDIGKSSYTFPADGTLVDLGAHMHAWQGAKKVDVFLNDTKIYTFTSVQGEEPWEWSTKRVTIEKRVAKGDTLSLSATYDNLSSTPVVGAMAMVGASYAPDAPHNEELLSY